MYQKLEFIISRLSSENRELIITAFNFAFNAHINQKRIDGEPYIVHPLEVAYILSEMNLDVNTIIGGLLHDVIEDTEFTYSDISATFGEEVAILVEGVSKLDKINYKTKEEAQADNIRKMLMAMTKDIRVILIKLADRLHNMRTLKYLSEYKQQEKSKETLNIFVPLAHRLGISKIKWELEDLSFRYLNPDEYYRIAKLVSEKRDDREKLTNEIIKEFKEVLNQSDVNAVIEGRPKHLYSIYKKLIQKNKTIDEIFDLIAIRVIVDSIKDCYVALGLAHEKYNPISNKFKDYIAMPKSNNYQSLHTTVLTKGGKPFEIQIRTKKMHKVAELGIAAHFKYKEQTDTKDRFDEKFVWIREVVEWLTETKNPTEAMENFKTDLIFQEIFVFTPKGKVIALPIGSTPVDFAFRIHTDVGYRCEGARVNNKIVTLDHILETGNIVEIITSKQIKGPSIDWLGFVKSNHTKSKIRQWFNRITKEDNVYRGKYLFEKECKKRSIRLNDVLISKLLKILSLSSLDELYFNLGIGNITFNLVLSKISELLSENIIDKKNDKKEYNIIYKKYNSCKSSYKDEILIEGQSNLLIKFAKCCTPVCGDEILGFITRGKGITVHRSDCKNIIKCSDKERLIDLDWYNIANRKYDVDICVTFRNVKSSIIEDVSKFVKSFNIYIRSINFRELDSEISRIDIRINIDSREKLDKLISSLKSVKGVYNVFRPNTNIN
ncbi:RelA/SpoT family protein [Candidatus Arthromitus sp. SFB-rat-Yit]|uniref:RelA/SpoT family protein n=1 Tax=Candidatus Arthromitus sp. SFB-rat-Yit TaxID=1041504 RepID=UPI000227A161|nr:bifunctional (p)ppGpp synthetase/guanosine-3',5'-bis(diphosphate) 3'-pyrophosphohydrolase [Candidatus Arthromitus sp. SFB-rat-Yit]BAK81279.1 RelA/SpoT protein, (p)ppGpp synthetase/pyrophosphohydrolase [Candidatus Arthromitus sp. SFB-rat-Yit]